MSRLAYSAYVNKKCIAPEMLENLIYEYCGIRAKKEHISEQVILYSGFDEEENFFVYFHHSRDKDRYPFFYLCESAILEKDFYYVQDVTVEIVKELGGQGYDKGIIEFFFFLKARLDCDMLITNMYQDICFISRDKVRWMLRRSCLLKIPNPHWQEAREEEQGTAKCVLLITGDAAEIENLYLQWNGGKTEDRTEIVPFEVNLHEEGIYAVYCGFVKEYDEKALQQVNISTPYRYAFHYSNRETIRYFIEKTNFSEGSYLENGRGKILPVEEVRKDILGFIE